MIFSSVLPSLIDRLGDAKDQVRDQDQSLLLKIMEQAVSPQVSVWPPAVCLSDASGGLPVSVIALTPEL